MATASRPEDPQPSDSELQAMQAAAKWLVGTGAAVIAALIAGLQLSTLTRLTFATPDRLKLAVGLVTVCLLAVGIVLVVAARVLVHPGWTPDRLKAVDAPVATQKQSGNPIKEFKRKRRGERIKKELSGLRTMIVPGTAPLDLFKLYQQNHELLTAWHKLYDKGSASIPQDSPPYTYQLAVNEDVARLSTRLKNVQDMNGRLAQAANLIEARRRYRRLTAILPWLGVILISSIISLAYLGATSADIQLSTPLEVSVVFEENGEQLKTSNLPEGCSGQTVPGVAVGGSLRRPVVTSTNASPCELNQDIIPSDVARIVPKVPSK